MKNAYWFLLLLLGGCSSIQVITTSRSSENTYTTVKATFKGDITEEQFANTIHALVSNGTFVRVYTNTPKKVRFNPVQVGYGCGWVFEENK